MTDESDVGGSSDERPLTDEEVEELLDTVKYTANIREFSLGEITNYLSFDATPNDIEKSIRPYLYDLSLVRDGSSPDSGYRTIEKEEISPETVSTVSSDRDEYGLPPKLESEIESQLPKLEQNRHLREAVDSLRGRYWSSDEVDIEYSRWDCLAYLVYHFPAYFAEARDVFSKIPLKTRMKVLDIGAGVGAPALALEDYLGDETLIDYTGLEPSIASEFLEELLEVTGPNFHATIEDSAIEDFELSEEYDLIMFFNVINELDEPKSVVERLLGSLDEEGSLLVVEPAELETSVPMRELQRELDDRYTVYGPCIYMWGLENRCTDRCWSFDKVEFNPPGFALRFADGNTDYLRDQVKYSYFVLRKDSREKRTYDADVKQEAMMKRMDEHVGNRIRITVSKMSHDLGDDMYKVCDGSAEKEHYAVLRGETEFNSLLKDAEYGEILQIDNALVYHNENKDTDDPESYHLVVDEDSAVSRVDPA